MTSVLPTVLTLEETAAYLRLSPKTVAQRASQGDIPGRCIDNTWHFHKPAIEHWLHTHDKRTAFLKQAGAFADDETLETLQVEIDPLVPEWRSQHFAKTMQMHYYKQ
jgi:Helix-turn-helix domain